jgi:hypothetical protein
VGKKEKVNNKKSVSFHKTKKKVISKKTTREGN